jgi:hypothetical protein
MTQRGPAEEAVERPAEEATFKNHSTQKKVKSLPKEVKLTLCWKEPKKKPNSYRCEDCERIAGKAWCRKGEGYQNLDKNVGGGGGGHMWFC